MCYKGSLMEVELWWLEEALVGAKPVQETHSGQPGVESYSLILPLHSLYLHFYPVYYMRTLI